MKIILNEREIIRKALEEGYIDADNPSSTIKSLIKHYLEIKLDKEQIKNSIDSFMIKNYKNYNPVKWKDRIRKWISKESKKTSPIACVESILVTIDELKAINSIGDINLEKVAFVYLVHSKILNQINRTDTYWVNSKMSDILKEAKVTNVRGLKEQEAINRELCNLGLIQYSYIVDLTNNKVCFAYESSEVVIIISDFRDYVLNYLKWKGENIINCESCNALIKPTGKNHKMCRVCWKDHRRKYQKELMHEKRKNI